MRKFLIVCAMAIVTTALANASMIAILNTGPTPAGTDFAYNYRVDVAGDESLNPTATDGTTCPGPGTTQVQCNPTGTFFTIYDIPGFVSASTTAAGWSESSALMGKTPSSINGASIDSPTLTNVTFTYTGPVTPAGGSTLSIPGFQVLSTIGTVNPNGTFTSQSTQNTGPSAGSTDQTIGSVSIPQAAAVTTPEPAMLSLVGSGLLILGGLLRRLRI